MTDPFQLSQPLVEVYEACVDELLTNLARHFNVKATGPTASFSYETRMLAKFGAINRESAAIIARHVAGADEMVRLAVEQAMLEAIAGEEPSLQAAARQGLVQGTTVPVQESIQARLTAYSRQAVDQLNLVNTVMLDGTWQAYQAGVYQAADVMRQLDAAQTALNQETGKVITGVSSRQQAVRSAVKKMADAGITGFIDHGGHRWSPEAYVRMDIKTTCSNAARQAVFDRNKDYGNDLVWVRVNATARPGCYPWQGKVISTQGRSGVTYDLDDRAIPFYSIHDTTYGQPDGLWGINCHHGPPNVFLPGLSSIRGDVPSAGDNAAAYALTQRQRQLERQVRYAKREAAMLDAAGDKDGFDQAALRVKQRQQALRDFTQANNLPMSGDRTQVLGYNRSVAGKAASAARRKEADNALLADLRAAGVRGQIHLAPTPIDVAALGFDDAHINSQRGHGITEAQARDIIRSAKVSVSVWNGQYERYYSPSGAAYVNMESRVIRTAFGADEFSGDAAAIMEVIKQHGR